MNNDTYASDGITSPEEKHLAGIDRAIAPKILIKIRGKEHLVSPPDLESLGFVAIEIRKQLPKVYAAALEGAAMVDDPEMRDMAIAHATKEMHNRHNLSIGEVAQVAMTTLDGIIWLLWSLLERDYPSAYSTSEIRNWFEADLEKDSRDSMMSEILESMTMASGEDEVGN